MMMKKTYVIPVTETETLGTVLFLASSVETDTFVNPDESDTDDDEEQHISLTEDEYDGEFYARTMIEQEFWAD
ncbi:MAG: hypothetical protein IJ064_03030 [Bacteroidaceae bacterium]|nr:hypothetical protein [Bacteroidaceae bacterium]